MLGEFNENIWGLKLHIGKEIHTGVYKKCYTFYHNCNQMLLQIVILIRIRKL